MAPPALRVRCPRHRRPLPLGRLLARIDEVFPLRCPGCGANMRTLSSQARARYRHPPPPEPAHHAALRLPRSRTPQTALELDAASDFDFDQTSAFDRTDAEPIPDSENQTRGA